MGHPGLQAGVQVYRGVPHASPAAKGDGRCTLLLPCASCPQQRRACCFMPFSEFPITQRKEAPPGPHLARVGGAELSVLGECGAAPSRDGDGERAQARAERHPGSSLMRVLLIHPDTATALTRADLDWAFHLKHHDLARGGWSPQMQRAFDYFNPDDHYEALVAKLVQPDTRWLDVGCGRSPFPNHPRLAETLAARCRLLVGVDPSDTLDDNTYIHAAIKRPIEDFQTDDPFDLVTLRMVAEHIENPERMMRSLVGATRPGSKVVVYTVNKWSPVPLATRLVPFPFHHPLKNLVWDVDDNDTFPTHYRLNTRRALTRSFSAAGFTECFFTHLDDCRTFGGFRHLRRMELRCRAVLHRLGLRHPESCLLAVFNRL